MPESESMVANDDDEILTIKDSDSNSSKRKRSRLTFPFGACRVCSDSATGIHYGIATCEGCKGFFKRSILRKEKYRCYFDSTCLINVTNRNRCKACRFRRCIDEGMSVDGVKMGRIPKLVKERALKELKEQQMKQEAALAEANVEHARESSCSSISDRSIENYDPNAMETDSMESQVSPVQRQNDLTNTYIIQNSEKKLSVNSLVNNDQSTPASNNIYQSTSELNLSQNNNNKINSPQSTLNNEETKLSQLVYRTKYPTFLPIDFTADETDGLSARSTSLLSNDVFQHVQTISMKLNNNRSNLIINLNKDEASFISFLRWSAYNIFLRYSQRAKQLTARMNQMIEKNIQEYPGENATLAEFFASLRTTCEVYTHATVIYIQDIPGMKNMNINDLQKMLVHRSFDWHILKYHNFYNDNGQCYFLAPDGLQITRAWLNHLHGSELTDAMFDFSRCFRELNLNENEFSLVLPFHMCYYDSTMDDQETPRMLRSCYLYALYDELCQNRGEIDGKIMCSKILQVLDLLIPLNELYKRDSASRILQA